MKVLITYNTVGGDSAGTCEDYLCHYGVMDEVDSVRSALKELGYSFSILGIGNDVATELKELLDSDADVVFNLCESIKGKSRLQPCFAGTLELLGIPFTGSDSAAITLAIDKRKTKALMQRYSIPTPPEWDWRAFMDDGNLPDDVEFPCIVKPAMEDGSIGIDQLSVVEGKERMRSLLKEKMKKYGEALLIERFIAGREFYVGFLGNDPPLLLPIAEIRFESLPQGYRNIMSYQAKWEMDSIERKGFRRICPAEINDALKASLIKNALDAYRIVGLYGYGRIDLRVDEEGIAYVIDVNANPDITRGQGFPLTAEIGGISYPELIERLIRSALARNI